MPRLAVCLLALTLVAAAPKQDADEQACVIQWLFDNVEGESQVTRWWNAVDYGMTDGGFVLKNFRVLRAQARSKKTGEKVDRVFVVDPLKWELHSSAAWEEIKPNQPTPESWYREEFFNIYKPEPAPPSKTGRKR